MSIIDVVLFSSVDVGKRGDVCVVASFVLVFCAVVTSVVLASSVVSELDSVDSDCVLGRLVVTVVFIVVLTTMLDCSVDNAESVVS